MMVPVDALRSGLKHHDQFQEVGKISFAEPWVLAEEVADLLRHFLGPGAASSSFEIA